MVAFGTQSEAETRKIVHMPLKYCVQTWNIGILCIHISNQNLIGEVAQW